MVNVRRKLYEPSSPAGKGTKWEWAGPSGSGDWHCYNMKVQCIIEAAWAKVTHTLQLNILKTINACMQAMKPRPKRSTCIAERATLRATSCQYKYSLLPSTRASKSSTSRSPT